ncbi:peptidyl-prolyl cis-trans isomerase, rhodopsin-specific isozyme-like isoform X2 [Maniola hyperantus]|uniref:peptidyl-prolyl cis-trans isomerase, rhodopsin-specific isozyme-like isoform X2 n=1 Tax=Aphantopus hyperantus TaxID=2795564 RepID=UPI003747EA53
MNFLLFLPIFSHYITNISARQLRITDQVYLDVHHQDKPLGGDVVSDDGTGSISIYGPTFPDENLDTQHSSAGFVSMANKGKNTNGCQFIITTKGTPWLDGIHTVIGKVVDGQKFVHMVEQIPTDAEDRPKENVFIFDSGVLPTEPFYISDNPNDLWGWIKASAVPLTFSFTILGFFQWMISKMDI